MLHLGPFYFYEVGGLVGFGEWGGGGGGGGGGGQAKNMVCMGDPPKIITFECCNDCIY